MVFGYIASAVCSLVGPIFIPWLLFEPLAFLFWGWLKCFLQYAFYPVIGAAYVHIFATVLVNVITDTTQPLANFIALIPLLVLVIVGMLNAPKMCAALFSGGGGEPGIASLAAGAAQAALSSGS